MKQTWAFLVLAASVFAGPSAHAQTVGTLFSGPTTGDGSSAFWNPATMSEVRGSRLEVAGGLSFVSAAYDPTGDRGASTTFGPAPNLSIGFASDVIGKQFRVGFNITAPALAGGGWGRDDEAGTITRYFTVNGLIPHLAAIPAISYTPTKWLSLGFAVKGMMGYIDVELDKDLGAALNTIAGSDSFDSPFPFAEPALAAPIKLNGFGFGIGVIGGLVLRPIQQLTIGFGIHSPLKLQATGSVEVDYPERLKAFVEDTLPSDLPDLNGDLVIDLGRPLLIFTGISFRPTPRWEFAIDYRFEQRSKQPVRDVLIGRSTSPSVDDTTLVNAFRNRHGVSARVAYTIIPRLTMAFRLRYENKSVPERAITPSNLDFEKLEFGLVGRIRVSRRINFSVQYAYTLLIDTVVNDSLYAPNAIASLATFSRQSPVGVYSGSSHQVSFGVQVRVGKMDPQPRTEYEIDTGSPAPNDTVYGPQVAPPAKMPELKDGERPWYEKKDAAVVTEPQIDETLDEGGAEGGANEPAPSPLGEEATIETGSTDD